MKERNTLLKVVAALLILLITACGEEQKREDTIRIGAAMSSFSDKAQTYLQNGIQAFSAENQDVEIIMTDGKDDPAVQINQIENLLVGGVDALFIVPVDVSALKPIFKESKKYGVKVVIANRLPEEEYYGEFDAYVGSDSLQAGYLQGEWVAQALQPEGGKVGIMMGGLGHEAARMRTQGNKEIFSKYDNIEVVVEAEAKWDRAEAMRVAENWFQSGIGLDAVLCNNDEMAIGTLLAAQGAGLTDEDIIITGIDASPDALAYLGMGLDLTIFQNMHFQGYGGIEAAYKLAKGEEVEKWVWIPFEVVSLQNVETYK